MSGIIDLSSFHTNEILSLYSRILNELARRRIVRSKNNPVADYAEILASKALDLTLAGKGATGYDAQDVHGNRYQIKCRRCTPENKSRQLSPFRNLTDQHFDYLIAIVFDQDFYVALAYEVPWRVVLERSTHRTHVNGHILHARDNLLNVKGVEDLTRELQEFQLAEHERERGAQK